MITTIIATLAFAAYQAAEPPPHEPLLGFEALQGRLEDKSLRLLDVRPRADYDKGHIPGAVWADAKAVEALAARPGALKDEAAWAKWIAPLGIGPDSRVYVYGDNRQLDAARVWWLLGYLGAPNVGLIDGNFKTWASEGRPVAKDAREVEPRPFPIKFRGDRLATRDELAGLLKKGGAVQVVDARTIGEHEGSEKRSKRAGRIPEACHLEWADLVDKDGRFLAEPVLRSKIAKAGISPDAPVVTHCQGGGRASVDAFVFEKLGYRTRNYYLGWSDWGNAEETPVETGPKADR